MFMNYYQFICTESSDVLLFCIAPFIAQFIVWIIPKSNTWLAQLMTSAFLLASATCYLHSNCDCSKSGMHRLLLF